MSCGSEVKEGGYDQKMNETVNVVTTKTSEIGQKTWGIMKGVMAMASQKVEEYTKEGINWKADDQQQNTSHNNGYYQEFGRKDGNGWESSNDQSSRRYNSATTWDDWEEKDKKVESGKRNQNGDGWAGWDQLKDDYYDDDKHHSSSDKGANLQAGKSDSRWTDGGFL